MPGFTDVDVFDDSANRQYIIKLRGGDGKWFSSRVLSEGTLRILALCILEYDEKYTGLLCFEEPENGIHPFRINATTQLLKDLSSSFKDNDDTLRQVIVNTHSPVVISQLVRWSNDISVSVWLSRQNILIKEYEERKFQLKITRMIPVQKISMTKQLLIPFSNEFEQKMTLSELENYLLSIEAEEALKVINS